MDTYKLNFTILDLEVLSYLSLRTGEKLSQREIALALKVSPTAVKNSIDNLKDLIKVEKTKTINFISYNRDNPLAIKLKRIENLKHLELSGLNEYLEEKFAGATIILFGSYSKGEDTINSDVDIAIIGRKDKLINLEKYEKILFRKINLNFYPSFKEIHKHLKNNILNGIVLVGSVEL
ncbi:MAG: nucleotidyltransferase family protein [Candidatus Woesearchaeota archaeon]